MSVLDIPADAPLFLGDYVPGVVGHAVLVAGKDHTGAESVAVWQVGATGQPTGAWIVSLDTTAHQGTALRLLGIVRRRAVIGWDSDVAGDALHRLAIMADVPAPAGWEETAVYLPDVLTEIADHRRACTDAVARYRATTGPKSKVLPLTWHRDVPTGAMSLAELAALAGLPLLGISSEVVDRVLQLSRLVAWTAQLWQETEQVRLRRRYLVDEFGPAAVLPPRWLTRLRAAAAPPATPDEPALARTG